jgi:ribokinase
MMENPFAGVRIIVLGAHTGALQFILSRFPAPGDYLVARSLREAADGAKGSNQAIAAARLGARVTLLSAVGDDERGRDALAYMRAEGIDTSRVATSPDHPTGFGAGFYLEDGSVMGATYVGAAVAVTPDYLDAQAEVFDSEADAFLASLEIAPEVALAGLELAKTSGIPLTILNPSPADDLRCCTLPPVDVLTPNEPEARLMAGLAPDGKEPIATVARLVSALYGVPLVIVTLGGRGCYILGRGLDEQVPCPAVDAIDTSGAGDCFNSALAIALATGRPTRRAVTFALAAASISVTRRDSWPAYPTYPQVAQFLEAPPAARDRVEET